MISGIVVTTMTDMGPYPLLNISPISEDTTVKLSVIGMTILSMGAGTAAERHHYRLHGSIPIPDSPSLEALAMSFTVTPTESKDIRITQHGRESTIWLLFDTKNREQIFRRHRAIETALKEESKSIHKESDLSDPTIMERILERIIEVSKIIEVEETDVSPIKTYYIPERGGLDLFTIDNEGTLTKIDVTNDISSHSILLVCNNVIKRIFLMKLKDEVSQRLLFLAGKSASNLNMTRYKNEFTIRNVLDPIERELILEKIGIIQKFGI